MPLYVYAIMRTPDALRAAAGSTETQQLAAVEHEGLGALVSPTPDGELRLRRDNILGHADVLQRAFEHGPLLPFRFGTVVSDEETVVRDVLAHDATGLAARLDALENAVEMQLKATYGEAELLRSILAQDEQLTRAVERMRELPAAATHFERIRIGEAIAAAVQTRRGVDENRFIEALKPFARAVSVAQPHHERSVLNASFLVERTSLPQFDSAVEGLSEQRSADVEFKLIGPLPPYSFADRDWRPGAVLGVNA